MSSLFIIPCRLLCGNCRQPMENETSTTTILSKDFHGPSADEIQIIDAIAYIYGVSWNEFEEYSEQYSKSYPEDNFRSEEMETSLRLCVLCAKLLSNNFTAHRRFENVSHPSSVIQKMNTFRQQKKVQSQSAEEKEVNATYDCDCPIDIVYNDDMFENVYYCDQDGELEKQMDIDIKFEPVEAYNKGFQQKSLSLLGEEFSNLALPEVTKDSLRSRQLFVKMERLSEKECKDLMDNLKQNKKRRYKTRIKRLPKKRTRSGKNVKDEANEQNESDIDKKKNTKLKVKKSKKSNAEKEMCECKICGKTFTDVKYYKEKHLLSHYRNPFIKCQFCEKLVKKRNMRMHIKKFHAAEYSKKIDCTLCDKKIVDYRLRTHMKVFHSGPRKTHKCDKCDKEYLNKQMYKEHILTHSESFTPHLCVVCGKTFVFSYAFETHVKKHEKGAFKTSKFCCDRCPFEFVGRLALEEHIKGVHMDERSYVCDECGKTYKWKRQLAQHVKLHKEIKEKGDKSVKCEKCNVVLKHSLSLTKHNFRFHKDVIKVYDCSFCGKRFTCATYLRKHEQQHKENPNFNPSKGSRTSKLFKQQPTTEDDKSDTSVDPQKHFIVCSLNNSNPT